MKLLLLGRDGQIGRALAPRLAALGELVACGRAEADFERPGELPRLVAAVAPDVIVNAAAYTAVDRAESEPERARIVNAEAVAILADAARRAGAWLVHYSTDYVFDGAGTQPYVETDVPHPLNTYGVTKLRGDIAIAESGCRHLVFRIAWVYGLGSASFARTMLRLAGERTRLEVVADQVGAPTSATLVAALTADAIARVGEAPEAAALSGTYHLAPTGEVSRADYVRFLLAEARAAGAPLRLGPEAIVPVATAAMPTPAVRPLNSRLATGKLRATFGFALPAWQDDVRAFVGATVARGLH
jgi:dTDP-4-dehydrorhamnose reductase